jgi:hypothetical protein
MRRTAAVAFVAALSALARADEPTADAVRAARDLVMRRPEFRYDKPKGEWFLSEWFAAWNRFVAEFQAGHPALFVVIVLALAAALVVLLAHIAWTLRMGRAEADEPRARADLRAAMRVGDPTPFRARAVSHAEAGRFDDAVRDLYAALLLALDRRGALRYASHKALLDYRIEAARDADAAGTLDLFAGGYHPGSFGRRPPDRRRFDDLLRAFDAVATAPAR